MGDTGMFLDAVGGEVTPRTPTHIQNGDVLAIIEHIDTKIDGLRRDLLTVIHEGRDAHTREHAPLQAWYEAEQKADQRRDARVKPLVGAAEWATNHWLVTLSIAGFFLVVWSLVGHWVHP